MKKLQRQYGPFQDEKMELSANLAFIGEQLQVTIKRRLKQFGINDQHLRILRVLETVFPEAITTGKIKSALNSGRGDLTRLLDKLEKRSLVLRERNPLMKTEIHTMITPGGRQLLNRLGPIQLQNGGFDLLSEVEARTVNQILTKLL